MKIVIGVLAALIALGGGTSLAAQAALPGDALYPVKVSVNERIRVGLAVSAEARARVQADLAERRVEEAERVAAQAELRADVEADLEERFEAFADRVEERIRELEAKGSISAAVDVMANFETALEAHDRILVALSSRAEANERASVEAMRKSVVAEEEHAEDVRVELEAKMPTPDVQAAAEGRLIAAENKIVEVERFIASVKARLDANETADAEARLSVAEHLVVQGKEKLTARAYAEAFDLFSAALSTAQEAQILAAANLDLNVDIELNAEEEREVEAAEEARVEIDVEAEVDADVDVNIP